MPKKLLTSALLLALVSVLGSPLPAATKGGAAVKSRLRYFRKQQPPRQTTSQPPGIAVVNAASFLPGVSPGGLVTIFGQGLTYVNGVVVASSTPLPLQLGGIQVIVNGIPAGIFSVADVTGEDQISFQVPWETDTGPGAAQIAIVNSGDTVGLVQTDSYTEDPGIFVSHGIAVALTPGFSLITPDNPAVAGTAIVLYTTGLGPVSLDVPDGFPGPSSPLANTLDPFQVLVEGEPCQVIFSGLAPGFVGVYQLNILLPGDLPPGILDIQISSPYATSNTTRLPVVSF